jgi:hypothetical protein
LIEKLAVSVFRILLQDFTFCLLRKVMQYKSATPSSVATLLFGAGARNDACCTKAGTIKIKLQTKEMFRLKKINHHLHPLVSILKKPLSLAPEMVPGRL